MIIVTTIIIISKILFLIYYSDFYNFKYHILFFELSLFLLGGITYNIKLEVNSVLIKKVIFITSILLIISLNYFVHYLALKWVIYIIFSLSIPIVFSLTKYNTFDKLLGDLSYPIYISHILVIAVLREFETNTIFYVIYLVVITIVTSAILNYIILPIEKFRALRLKKSNP